MPYDDCERTVYVSPNTRPGDSVRWGDWRDSDGAHTWYDGPEDDGNRLGRYTARGIPMTVILYASGSDYSGNLVEASNARVLKERFPRLVTLYGGHGTFGVAYLGKRENQDPELIEAIDALKLHPLVDEDDHSALEMETADEAWSAYGRTDWKHALIKLFCLQDEDESESDYDGDQIPDDAADRLWYDCVERLRGGEAYLNESGDSIWFPIDRVIEDFRRDAPALYRDFTWGDDPRPLVEKLETVRQLARVKEG